MAEINGRKSGYYDFRYRALAFDKFVRDIAFSFHEPSMSAYEDPSLWNAKIILELNHISDPLANLIETCPNDFVLINFSKRIANPLDGQVLLDDLIKFMRDHHSY